MTVEPYHFEFMAEAIREAEISIAQGGLPIGAVLTRDQKIIARGHNRRVQEQNVILHGEMSCMRNAGLIPFMTRSCIPRCRPVRCARARSDFSSFRCL